MNDEELSEVTSEETSEETSVGSLEDTSEETSEETSEPTLNAETLESINTNLESVRGLLFVGLGFIIFFFLVWMILKVEKMLETYF